MPPVCGDTQITWRADDVKVSARPRSDRRVRQLIQRLKKKRADDQSARFVILEMV